MMEGSDVRGGKVCTICGDTDWRQEIGKESVLGFLRGGDGDKRGRGDEISLVEEDFIICGDCKRILSSAMASKEELEDREREVRRRQLELLRELRKLEDKLKVFKRWMLKLDKVALKNSKEDDDRLGNFRKKIMKVVGDLQIFHYDISLFGRNIPDRDLGRVADDSGAIPIKTEVVSEHGSDLDLSDFLDDDDPADPVWSPEVKLAEVKDIEKAPQLESSNEDSEEDGDDGSLDLDNPESDERSGTPAKKSQSFQVGMECSICGKPVKQKYIGRNHRRSHMNAEEKAAEETSYNLRRSKPPTGTVQCSTCGKVLLDKYSLKRHLESHIIKETCNDCGESFTNSRLLQFHTKKCPAKAKVTHICNLCNKSMTTEKSLKEHIASVHATEMNLSCPICPKTFPTKRKLRVHLNWHARSTFFPCTKNCGTILKSAKNLRNHESLCQGEGVMNKIPAECPICKITIKSKNLLNRHIKTRHLNEPKKKQKILCTHCPKMFHPSAYKEHLRRVTGERPFLCRKGCGAGFSGGSSRKRHEGSCTGSGTAHGRRPIYVAPPTSCQIINQ